MKIGILTLPLHTNYGGILQAYALQTVLERLGHDAYVLDRPFRKKKRSFLIMLLVYIKRIVSRFISQNKKVHVFQEEYEYKRIVEERKYTQVFINKSIKRFLIQNVNDIKKEDFDAFIVGSDQIWRPDYYKWLWKDSNYANAFLEFTTGWNVLRISYAASFGSTKLNLSSEELNRISSIISTFKSVSVREDSGLNVCSELFKVNAKQLVDPVMLLTTQDYCNIINCHENLSLTNTLMSYILDETEETVRLRNHVAKDRKLEIKITNSPEFASDNKKIKAQPPLEDWIKTIAESKFIITDSFHACVFSILFRKDFAVVANNDRGVSRIESLLKLFGLTGRLINTVEEFNGLTSIDYSSVDKILEEQRSEGLQFLQNNLRV